uniref:Tudor domain-containing protein n=1 Tax=Haemonchus contortus TaxID=6289 RepID=A0A7I4Y984_HAECO
MADEELASYRLQFQQVEAALLGDPDNEELKKLKADLEEVIALQEELASASASSSANETARVTAPARKYQVGDRVMAPLPNGNRGVAVVDSLTAAGVAVLFISSGQKTIVDPSDLSDAPDAGKKHYVFDTRSAISKTAANKKEWLAERERRRLRAQKKEMKRKELDLAKESEKNNWLKFNNKAVTKGIKGMKRITATGSAQDGPAGGVKAQTIVSSRANQFAFKSARGAMDSLF